MAHFRYPYLAQGSQPIALPRRPQAIAPAFAGAFAGASESVTIPGPSSTDPFIEGSGQN